MNYQLINPINEDYTATQQVLTNRGIPLDEIKHYLHPSPADNLSPTLLSNIDLAARVYIKHISQGSKILVVVDCDCDGMTSAALLLNYTFARTPSIVGNFTYVFHRGKQHGLNDINVPDGFALVICPDASSNDYAQHKALKERGIDVLVLDHHIADTVSADAVVVNNQLCDYPTKSLSGVGIVYKFCQYLDSLYGDNKADEFLDLVATGLTGDMMDMRDIETHYLTKLGLADIRNPFIAGMIDKNSYSIGDVISPYKVAFYVVPLINSITRVGTQEEKKLLFESMLSWKAYELVPSTKRGATSTTKETRLAQALRVATNVKNRQTTQQDNSLEFVEQVIKKNNLLDHKVLVIQLENASFSREITGLIANKLMAEYQRPVTLLIRTTINGKIAWSGSARGYSRSTLTDFRQFCRDSGLVYLAEGHPNAFGFGIYDSNVKAFIEYADEQLKDLRFEPCYKVDFVWTPQTVKPNEIIEIGNLDSLWGQEMDEPLVAMNHIRVTSDNLQLLSPNKSPSIKITLPNGINILKFKSSEEEYDTLYTPHGGVIINVIGVCQSNRYYGSVTPQIIVKDYEIVDREDWVF